MLKLLKIIVFAVGTYYILKFVMRLINAKRTADREIKKQQDNTPQPRKPGINPNAGEYTDYEEIKD